MLGDHPVIREDARALSGGVFQDLLNDPYVGPPQYFGASNPGKSAQFVPNMLESLGPNTNNAQFSTRSSVPMWNEVTLGRAPDAIPSALADANEVHTANQNTTSPTLTGARAVPLLAHFLPHDFSGIPRTNDANAPSDGNKTDDNSHVYVRIHHPGSAAWLDAATGSMQDQPFAASDDGEELDPSAYWHRAQYIHPSAITGDPRIDGTTQHLLDALVQSVQTMGKVVPPEMLARVFGVLVHTDFGKRVKILDLPGIGQKGVEQSWDAGGFVRYGLAGSYRTDVLLTDREGQPLAIYDLKTGNARLTRARIEELRRAVRAPGIPVIELRYGDLMALQR